MPSIPRKLSKRQRVWGNAIRMRPWAGVVSARSRRRIKSNFGQARSFLGGNAETSEHDGVRVSVWLRHRPARPMSLSRQVRAQVVLVVVAKPEPDDSECVGGKRRRARLAPRD